MAYLIELNMRMLLHSQLANQTKLCIYVCMYVCTYVCMYVYVCVYIYSVLYLCIQPWVQLEKANCNYNINSCICGNHLSNIITYTVVYNYNIITAILLTG